MTSNTNKPSQDQLQDQIEGSKPTEENSSIENLPSATTSDIPEFGWSGYAERINGRFAMIGFTAVLLIEALSHHTFLSWAGFIK